MRWLLVCLLVGLLAIRAGPARAGPWPRAAGESFVSVSATGGTGSVWFERGLGRGRWLVGEAMAGRDGTWAGALRFHRAMADRGAWRLAWSLGLSVAMPQHHVVIDLPPVPWPGRTEVRVTLQPVVAAQAGLSLGRGLERPWPGWFALDLTADLASGGWSRLRADATLGWRPAERWMVLIQAHGAVGRRRAGLALASSVVWQARKGLRLQAGVHHDLRGGRSVAKLGSWLEF